MTERNDLGVGTADVAQADARFGVLSVWTGNFLFWSKSRDDAEAYATRLRGLNHGTRSDAVEVVEFDAEGMPL